MIEQITKLKIYEINVMPP